MQSVIVSPVAHACLEPGDLTLQGLAWSGKLGSGLGLGLGLGLDTALQGLCMER